MRRSTVVIDLEGDAALCRDLAAGGVFVPGCTLRMAEECELVVCAAHRQVSLPARVVYVDPAGGAGLELIGFSTAMREQLAELSPLGSALDERAVTLSDVNGLGHGDDGDEDDDDLALPLSGEVDDERGTWPVTSSLRPEPTGSRRRAGSQPPDRDRRRATLPPDDNALAVPLAHDDEMRTLPMTSGAIPGMGNADEDLAVPVSPELEVVLRRWHAGSVDSDPVLAFAGAEADPAFCDGSDAIARGASSPAVVRAAPGAPLARSAPASDHRIATDPGRGAAPAYRGGSIAPGPPPASRTWSDGTLGDDDPADDTAAVEVEGDSGDGIHDPIPVVDSTADDDPVMMAELALADAVALVDAWPDGDLASNGADHRGGDADGEPGAIDDGDPDDDPDGPGDTVDDSVRRGATSRPPRNVHERLRGLNLAAQLKLAATGELPERVVLERLYGKNVWETLLRNPKLTPPEVARIARYGSLPRVLLEIIVGNTAWLAVPEVRRALLSNPRLATDQIVKVLRITPKHELRLAAIQTAYPHAVRTAARMLLRGSD